MSNRKVALVIHGMTAVGTAICRRLHDDGMLVAATWSARQRTPEAWLAAQRDDGYAFTACGVDVADDAACSIAVGRLLESHGRLDILVNQAGMEDSRDGTSLGGMSPEAWRRVVRRGVDGLFNMNKRAILPMLEQRWGRIIQVASAPAWPVPGEPQAVSHAAANAAMHGLTKALALEVARHGVTVNTVAPGYVLDSGDSLGATSPPPLNGDALAALIVPHIPVGRLGSPRDVAALVAYLASEEAAFVTGAQLAVNGGQYMM